MAGGRRAQRTAGRRVERGGARGHGNFVRRLQRRTSERMVSKSASGSRRTHRITETEHSAILDVQVDVCVDHFNAADDLTDIDVCNPGSVVGVRVGANDVCTTSL